MLKIENVKYRYNKNQAVESIQDVSLRVAKGECVLLCGRSGAGKTTVTKLINSLIPNYYESGELQGKIILDGMDVPQSQIYEVSRVVSSVFQNPKTQFFNVNTTSELLFYLENRGFPREEMTKKLAEVAEIFDIAYLFDRDIFELSGGEKQIIAIAAAFASGTEIVLLDEPSSNLDEDKTYLIGEILKKLKALGRTIIISEHRFYYIRDIIDRVYYFDEGRMSREFMPAEFFSLDDVLRKKLGLRSIAFAELDRKKKAKTTLSANSVCAESGVNNRTCPVTDAGVNAGFNKRDSAHTRTSFYSNNGRDSNVSGGVGSDLITEAGNTASGKDISRDISSLADASSVCSSETVSTKTLVIEKVEHLFKGQDRALQINDISYDFGRIIGIYGRNGVGKSTFIRILMGLEKSKCRILLDGKVLSPKQRLKKSYLVMQDVNHQLFTDSVETEVSLGKAEKYSDEDVVNTLKKLNIYDLKDKHPMSLSGGQKQRVAIASAILSGAEIICFDEPTSGMDYDNMMRISKLIKETINDKIIIFIISHDHEFLNQTVDEVFDISQFNIASTGRTWKDKLQALFS